MARADKMNRTNKKAPAAKPDMTAVVRFSMGVYTVWSNRSGNRVTESPILERAMSKAASRGYTFPGVA